jgi:hypothetical protein
LGSGAEPGGGGEADICATYDRTRVAASSGGGDRETKRHTRPHILCGPSVPSKRRAGSTLKRSGYVARWTTALLP